MTDVPYRSIACGAYDLLEAAALRRSPLVLRLTDGSSIEGRITNVYARGKEEFCSVEGPTAPSPEVRLDRIAEIIDPRTGRSTSTLSC